MGLSQVRSPVASGNQNRTRLLRFADQPLGQGFRDYAPIIWPGPPWQAWLGFITSANLTDDTVCYSGAPSSDCMRQTFHEIGVGQVPAGPRDGPAPNPDPNAAHNAWTRLARDADVVRALGRPATTVPNAWKTAPLDQAAVTIANLRSDYRDGKGAMDARIRPSADNTPWSVVVAYTSFSMGGGGAARFFNRFAAPLAGVPDDRKWGALLTLLNDGIRNGSIAPTPAGQHGNPFYDAMRTWQKMESARQLAQGTGGDAAFFATGLPNEMDVDDAITAGARGEHPGPIRGVSRERAATAGGIAGVGLLWAGAAGATALGVTTKDRWLPVVRRWVKGRR